MGSVAAAELAQRRWLLRVMQGRMAEFAAGKNRPHTTHLWPQLREAGVALSPVVWKGVEGKGGKGGKGSGGAPGGGKGWAPGGGKGWAPCGCKGWGP